MRFTTSTSLAPPAAAALLLLSASVRADLMAWTGPFCNLDAGANVVCNAECIAFSSRNSFQVCIMPMSRNFPLPELTLCLPRLRLRLATP
jgi:hypothetical protein